MTETGFLELDALMAAGWGWIPQYLIPEDWESRPAPVSWKGALGCLPDALRSARVAELGRVVLVLEKRKEKNVDKE